MKSRIHSWDLNLIDLTYCWVYKISWIFCKYIKIMELVLGKRFRLVQKWQSVSLVNIILLPAIQREMRWCRWLCRQEYYCMWGNAENHSVQDLSLCHFLFHRLYLDVSRFVLLLKNKGMLINRIFKSIFLTYKKSFLNILINDLVWVWGVATVTTFIAYFLMIL